MIKIAVFQSDATPPLGSPLCHGGVKPAKKIVAPLSTRGIVILGAEKPVVLCAVDWVCISGNGHDFWRKVLAESAGTTVERVTVHTIHPHDAPGHIFSSEDLADLKDTADMTQDTAFAESAVRKAAEALKASLATAKPVTHYGYGKAKVSQVASNRRILGSDGRVAHMRWSSCPDKALRDLPEGLIDPWLQNLSFWNGEERLFRSLIMPPIRKVFTKMARLIRTLSAWRAPSGKQPCRMWLICILTAAAEISRPANITTARQKTVLFWPSVC